MKLGEPSDSIYSNTYNLSQRLQGADYPLAESATLLTMEDGSFDWVKFGARVEYNGTLQIFDLLRADYFDLTTFIKSNIGNKIRFTLSNDSENPWTDSTFLNAFG